uniref:hypothetical protein n=1 Tax=Pseudomonas aeruginosa TaxID=287 RepID=UPI001EE6C00B
VVARVDVRGGKETNLPPGCPYRLSYYLGALPDKGLAEGSLRLAPLVFSSHAGKMQRLEKYGA